MTGVVRPNSEVRAAAVNAAAEAIGPVVAALLDAGISSDTVIGVVRHAFLDAAEHRLRTSGQRSSVSRVAAATGMTRTEVRHLLADRATRAGPHVWAPNASDRVISGWISDPDFLLADGTPRPLSYSDTGLGFPELVRRYSRGIPPRAMLNELIDAQRIRDIGSGSYLPSQPQPSRPTTPEEDYLALGAKLNALGSTLVQNLQTSDPNALFETFVLSQAIPNGRLPKTLRDLQRRCRTFSESIEQYLLDQSPPIALAGDDSTQQHIGVIVAMVNRSATPATDWSVEEEPS